ncbi:MAG TPA: hypothetical protein VHG52_14970 [Thermomicrobiales bacterium]|nr:hypothetical protein [Thermomicrobiales bacterium]
MNKLNYWNQTWSLDEVQCPCDLHFVEYLQEREVRGATIFHFGTGNHHIVGLKGAEKDVNNAVLGITASPQEYDDYVELLIKNPRLGHTYKAYFGDIYQLDARLLPQFDYVSLFHVGEFRTPDNDVYGALTDLEMTLLLADRVKPGGEILFYKQSFAYDKALAVAEELVKQRPFDQAPAYKSLTIYRKRTS